jgi:chemotaxis protein CheD
MEIVKVGMADMNISCRVPSILTTLGLGSCIGIALYDPTTKIAGLAHIMLPDSTQIKNNQNIAKFADTASIELINRMVKVGANKNKIVAKIAGGAQMFSFSSGNDMMKIGQRNALASKEILNKLGIRIISEDTGANYGRTIELYTENGDLLIKTIGKGQKVI